MSARTVVKWACVVAAPVAGVALAERIADPFDRHEPGYTVEGPVSRDSGFYMSVNYYSDGIKHDDRVGDLLIITEVASLLGAAVLSRSGIASDSPRLGINNLLD